MAKARTGFAPLVSGDEMLDRIQDNIQRGFAAVQAAQPTSGTVTWDPPSVPANSAVDGMFTVKDSAALAQLAAGMAITVTPPSTILAGLHAMGFCPAKGQLTIRLTNTTGGALNTASGAWAFSGRPPNG